MAEKFLSQKRAEKFHWNPVPRQPLDQIDDVVGKMGEVAECLVSDVLSVTNGTPKQMRDIGPTLVDPPGRGHMNGAASCWHAGILRSVWSMSR